MNFETLASNIVQTNRHLQAQTAHAVNKALTARNWIFGHYIVEYGQHGEDRAAYGEKLLKTLEQRLRTKGLTERRFREFRRLYMAFPELAQPIANYLSVASLPIRRTLTAELETSPFPQHEIRRSASAELMDVLPAETVFEKLPYSHLSLLSSIENDTKRLFYIVEGIRGCWNYRELDRQISSLYYERSGMSKDKAALAAMVAKTADIAQPTDILRDPVTLEFLGLNGRAAVTETDLEQAILDHLQEFFLEMGAGFCFEARQKRILVDGDYFKADLVFYHRILKCHVIVELKVDRFHHEYASQLNLYLNYYKSEVMQPDDNPPIGILLCTGYGDTIVKYATAGMDNNLFIKKYMLNLPSEEDIRQYIRSVKQ